MFKQATRYSFQVLSLAARQSHASTPQLFGLSSLSSSGPTFCRAQAGVVVLETLVSVVVSLAASLVGGTQRKWCTRFIEYNYNCRSLESFQMEIPEFLLNLNNNENAIGTLNNFAAQMC